VENQTAGEGGGEGLSGKCYCGVKLVARVAGFTSSIAFFGISGHGLPRFHFREGTRKAPCKYPKLQENHAQGPRWSREKTKWEMSDETVD
jgi:hypothetical protein